MARSWNDYKKTFVQPDTLCLAAKEGDLMRVMLFLSQGMDINAPDHRGYSPLMLACYDNHPDVAQHLIASGADVNSPDLAGNSILMGLCFKGNAALARMLIEAGAPVDWRNHGGQDAYDVANTFGRKDVVEILLAHGAKPRRSNRLLTFLRLALQRFSRR